MTDFLQTETLIIEMVLLATLVAIVVRRLRIPFTVALVVVGLAISASEPAEIPMTPDLILALFVPPLVFQAAFHIHIADLRRDLPSVLLLAVPGVVITMFVVGGLVSITTSLPLAYALVFGALIAATDPVAVVALFRTLGVPKRLALLVEGESLLNDGTAIVLYSLVLGAALTQSLDLRAGVIHFLWVSVGGIAIGLALGWAVSFVIARIDDYLIETTLTTVLAFGAYLVAERLHVSGVLAVVAAGLVNGNLGPSGMSPTTRIVLFNFWEYVAFLANALVFLLIGLRIDIFALMGQWQPIVAAVVAVLVARVVVVYGLGLLARRMFEPLPWRWQHVLAWSGLRGAISLALALSLPETLGPDRELMQLMAFGVVLFTLLAQGTTMSPLLRALGVVGRNPAVDEFQERHARLAAVRAGQSHLQRLTHEGAISGYTLEIVGREIAQSEKRLAAEVNELMSGNPQLATEELHMAWREYLLAQRGALLGQRRDGLISDEVFDRLVSEIDRQLDATGERGREG